MHEGASSAIKWNGKISDQFEVLQGDRQGGILSTDLYNVYIHSSTNSEAFIGGGGVFGKPSLDWVLSSNDDWSNALS
jgi:hypothetical protein